MFEHIKEVIKEAVEKQDFSKIKYSLSPEEKEYIFNFSESENEDEIEEINYIIESDDDLTNLLINLFTEDEAIKELVSIDDFNEFKTLAIILALPTDDLKMQYLSKFEDDEYKLIIIDSFENDENKKTASLELSLRKRIEFSKKLLIRPENDEYRKELVEAIIEHNKEFLRGDEYRPYRRATNDIIKSLSSDKLKIDFIDRGFQDKNEYDVFEIINSLESAKNRQSIFDRLSETEQYIILRRTDFKKSPEYDQYIVNGIDFLYRTDDSTRNFEIKWCINMIKNISSPTLQKKEALRFGEQLTKRSRNRIYVLDMVPSDFIKNNFEIFKDETIQSYLINTLIGRGEEVTSDILNSWKLFEKDNEEQAKMKKNELLDALKNNSNAEIRIKVIKFVEENQNIPKEKIRELGNILECFEYSNSQELKNLQDKLIPLVLASENPTEVFDKIEETFLKNNLPMMAKIYQCFTYLYPDFTKGGKFDFSPDSRVSPELINPVQTRRMQVVNRDADPTAVRFQIVYNDLFRIASRSNNRSFIEYLNNIEQGNILFLGISNGNVKYEQLDDDAKQTLSIFSTHLNTLYEKTQTQEKVLENLSPVEKIMFLNNAFKPTDRYSLPDRIVRNFAYQAGFDNFEQLKRTTIDSIRTKEDISRRRALELEQGKVLTLEQGDFVRAIGTIDSFGSSLNNGNVCKEYLGTIIGSSDSDTTPLDIDFTLISENGKDIYHNIESSPTGFGFGNIYIILKKDNPEINITRDSNGNLVDSEYKPDKIEMFGSKTAQGGWETHWGARTGIASSDIDYILFKEVGTIDWNKPYLEDGSVNYSSNISNNDLAILKNEIVKNGFYIPVVDFSGKLIFSAKEYEEIKEKMAGLSYYGSKEYHLGQHSQNDYVEQIKQFLIEERESVKEQSDKVYEALKKSISIVDKIDNPNEKLDVKNKIDLDITNGTVEILETGSSARGTNIPYEYDFDYIVRVDSKRLKNKEKLLEINRAICEKLGVENVPISDFRDVEATIEGLGKIDLDITYVQKTNKTDYTTEMSAKDRIDTLESIDPEMKDEVVANIVLAKMLLKKSGCYKPRRKSEKQGGLGGIGIENWITQNGGTLESAARSFLEASEGRSYDEFKTVYHVHDYGKNHISRGGYPYNDFVFDNMNATGYEKMKTALGKYINYVEGKTTSLPEIDEYLSTIRDKAKNSTEIAHNQELNSMFNAEVPKIQSNENVK